MVDKEEVEYVYDELATMFPACKRKTNHILFGNGYYMFVLTFLGNYYELSLFIGDTHYECSIYYDIRIFLQIIVESFYDGYSVEELFCSIRDYH